jgi:hypothetical protein
MVDRPGEFECRRVVGVFIGEAHLTLENRSAREACWKMREGHLKVSTVEGAVRIYDDQTDIPLEQIGFIELESG